MERTMSCEERIRRAEEIYNRRRAQTEGVRVSTSNVNAKEKVNYGLFKRMILQILICLFIYLILYVIKNSNYIFSEEVIKKTREFLSYDIDFQNVYNFTVEYYNNNIKGWLQNNEQLNDTYVNEQENINVENETLENEAIVNEIENIQSNLDGIGRWDGGNGTNFRKSRRGG